jgi:hypothetical protein
MERLTKDAERLLATTTTLIDSRRMPVTRPAAIIPPLDVPAMPEMPVEAATSRVPPAAMRTSCSHSAEGGLTSNAADGKLTTPRQPTVKPVLDQTRYVQPTKPPVQSPMAEPLPATFTPQADPPSSVGSFDPTQAPAPQRVATHEEIDRKIEAIYGVRQESDVVIFRSHRPEASEIQIAGDFNDWMPHTTPMRRLPDGDFEARLKLPRGRYRYRLVVDGRWSHDLFNPTIETNEYGELNSVVEIKQ